MVHDLKTLLQAHQAETLKIAEELIARVHLEVERRRRQHRAGPDAQRLRDIYRTIKRAAEAEAAKLCEGDRA